jgi:hypothetical protein
MTKRQLNSLIYLTGSRLTGYTVVTHGFDGCLDLAVPSVLIGNAIVKAPRTLAARKPDSLFPPRHRLVKAPRRIDPEQPDLFPPPAKLNGRRDLTAGM